ncbi:MAG TPA: hypothetical protein VGT08_15030 [Terracidiphilus sp.]|nr:hypothetical protein [Terracidiphilus sp.]
MKGRTILYRFGYLAALALIFAMGSRMIPAQSADSEAVSKLLDVAKSEAVLAEDDAAALDSFARSKLSWQSHIRKLNEIAEHINALGRTSKELSDQRALGSPWQQKAIDEIDPRLREMADLLTTTIKHVNERPSRVHQSAYRDYVHANYELASKTAGMIRDFVDYGKARSKAESLEAKLELSTSEKVD